MPLQKHFQVKFYDQDGSTFRVGYSTQRPEGTTTGYWKNTPSFDSHVNGGYGECVLDLALPIDNFGEGTTIDFMKVAKIYAVKVDPTALTQSETLIYTGFVSKYEPYITPDRSEGVSVTLLGLVSLLSFSYYKNGSSFTVSHSAQDPETIGRAIIDHVNTIYSGSLLSYSGDTTDPLGTNVTFTFTDQKWFDALKKTAELAGTGWWWKIDEQGRYWLKAKPASATHTFTIGKDIQRLNAPKDSEKVVNDAQVRRTSGTASNYSDSTSQANFGTGSPATGKRTQIVNDTSIQNSATADQRGNKLINDNKDEKVKATITVNANYDIETVKVGETCKVRNIKTTSTLFNDNMMISSVRYEGDTVTVELEEEPANFGRELASMISLTPSTAVGGSGGGSGSSTTFVDKETPSGTINGTNTAFTLANTPTSGSEHLYLNGVLQNAGAGNDYTISGANVTFASAPPAGSILLASYRY